MRHVICSHALKPDVRTNARSRVASGRTAAGRPFSGPPRPAGTVLTSFGGRRAPWARASPAVDEFPHVIVAREILRHPARQMRRRPRAVSGRATSVARIDERVWTASGPARRPQSGLHELRNRFGQLHFLDACRAPRLRAAILLSTGFPLSAVENRVSSRISAILSASPGEAMAPRDDDELVAEHGRETSRRSFGSGADDGEIELAARSISAARRFDGCALRRAGTGAKMQQQRRQPVIAGVALGGMRRTRRAAHRAMSCSSLEPLEDVLAEARRRSPAGVQHEPLADRAERRGAHRDSMSRSGAERRLVWS